MASGVRALELLLGTDSGYLREILTEELAKGLDAFWRISADDALDAARAGLVSVLGVSLCFCSLRGLAWRHKLSALGFCQLLSIQLPACSTPG